MLPQLLHSYASTAAVGVSGDHSRVLISELYHNDRESAPVIMYSQLLMTCVMYVLVVIHDGTNWKELGLQLGLLYPSLKGIDLEQRGNKLWDRNDFGMATATGQKGVLQSLSLCTQCTSPTHQGFSVSIHTQTVIIYVHIHCNYYYDLHSIK